MNTNGKLRRGDLKPWERPELLIPWIVALLFLRATILVIQGWPF